MRIKTRTTKRLVVVVVARLTELHPHCKLVGDLGAAQGKKHGTVGKGSANWKSCNGNDWVNRGVCNRLEKRILVGYRGLRIWYRERHHDEPVDIMVNHQQQQQQLGIETTDRFRELGGSEKEQVFGFLLMLLRRDEPTARESKCKVGCLGRSTTDTSSSTFRPSPGHHRTVSELVNEMEAASGENAERQEATPQPARPPIVAQHNNNNNVLPPSRQIPATLSSAFPPIAGLPRPQLQFGASPSQSHPQPTPQPTTPINRLAPAQPAPSATSSTGIVPPASNSRSHPATPSTITSTNAGLFSSVSPAVLRQTSGSSSTLSTSTPQDRQAVASNFSALRNIMNRRNGGSQTPQSKPSYGMPQSRTSGSPAPTGTPRTMSLPPSDAIAQAAAAADGLAKALSTPQAHEMANPNGSAPTSRAQTPQPMAPDSISTPIQLSQSSYTKVHISASPVSAPTRRIDLSTSRSMARLRSKDLQGEVFVLVTADADVSKETIEPPRPHSASPSAAATPQPGKDSASSPPLPVSGLQPKASRPERPQIGARNPDASAAEVCAIEAAVAAEIAPPTAPVSTSEMAEATQMDISESQTPGTSMLSGFITPPLSEADEVLAEFDDVESITSNFSDFEAGPSSSKAPADRVYVDLSGVTSRTVIQRLPQDCLQVVIPISARRRDELIARGFYGEWQAELRPDGQTHSETMQTSSSRHCGQSVYDPLPSPTRQESKGFEEGTQSTSWSQKSCRTDLFIDRVQACWSR